MKRLIISLAAVLLSLPAAADEGMWLLPLLKGQKFPEMQALGLKLQDYDIYNPDSASLKDAVVIFGGGCTGEIVSPEGLLLTNHHCGYGAIQRHSTLEHDYLTDGFWAMSRDQELPNPDLTVTFIDKIEDVTDYVKKELAKGTDPNSMDFLSPKFLNRLAKAKAGEKFLQDNPGTEVEIKAFYGGNQYFMFTKKIYSDIRLVGAPPSSIGKFGADTDNWMWPRHTGDFSVFRVYADADGNPAPYSDKNVPLRPKRWFKISLKGVEENDYAMMMGFPGRTNKYYTSWEVAERRDIDNTVRIHIRDLRQKAMLDEMLKDPAVRIQYASKYAGSTNAYKNAIGSNWAIKNRNFEQVKKEEQEKLIAWSNKMCEPSYPDALMALEQIVSDRKDLRFRSWMLDEAILRGIEFTSVPTQTEALIEALKGKDKQARQEQLRLLERAYHGFANSNYSPDVDKKIAKVMLKEYRSQIDPKMQPAYFGLVDKKFKGDTDRFVDYLFEASIFGSEDNFNKFLSRPSAKALENDPMILFAQSVRAEETHLKNALKEFEDGYAMAHRTYVKGLLAMYGDRANFPDANFTLRLTYGQVKGYSPRDCDYYGHQTTLDGVMEKEDSTNWEFVVPARLKELYAAKDFGRYKAPGGKMPVAFSTTTHTTGGNSGSPVMNADGELIGINFDRNWEGVGGDIQYLPDYQRSIIVDIRYVLFIIDKYAGAGYLLDEMEIDAETCNKDVYSITGIVSDKFNGKEVSLSLISGDSLLPLSVDTIQNAAFSFKGNEYLDNVAKVILNDPEHDYSCEVFLEKGNIQVTLDSISHAKGTYLNDLYAAYQSEYRLRASIAEKEYATNIQGKDDPKTERFESLEKEIFAYMSNFQIDNINNAVGKYLYVKEIGRFWDSSFWKTYERLPSDIKSHPKVQNYCMRRQEIDETQKAMDEQIGQKIKDIQLLTMDSSQVRLSDYLNDYLYIDIWASWCGPCIQEIPKLKSIQKKYKNKGLKIVLVSIDKEFASWIRAINEHASDFDHLIDLTGGKILNQEFSFSMIPHGILLNHEGVIIANNLWNVPLKKKLMEIYGE